MYAIATIKIMARTKSSQPIKSSFTLYALVVHLNRELERRTLTFSVERVKSQDRLEVGGLTGANFILEESYLRVYNAKGLWLFVRRYRRRFCMISAA